MIENRMKDVENPVNKRLIKSGAQGSVYALYDGKSVVKIAIVRDKEDKKLIQEEVNFLWQLENMTGVAKILSCAYNDIYFYIKSEKFAANMEDKDALSEFRNKPFSEKILIYRDLIDTLDRIHKAKIIHGDIKPQNFVIDKEFKRISFIDFGLALREPTSTLTGTIFYLSPELFLTARKKDYVDDLWALGLTIAEIEFGTTFYTKPNYEHCIQFPKAFESMFTIWKIAITPDASYYKDGEKRIERCKKILEEALKVKIDANTNYYEENCVSHGKKAFVEFFDKTLNKDPNKRAKEASEILAIFNEAVVRCKSSKPEQMLDGDDLDNVEEGVNNVNSYILGHIQKEGSIKMQVDTAHLRNPLLHSEYNSAQIHLKGKKAQDVKSSYIVPEPTEYRQERPEDYVMIVPLEHTEEDRVQIERYQVPENAYPMSTASKDKLKLLFSPLLNELNPLIPKTEIGKKNFRI